MYQILYNCGAMWRVYIDGRGRDEYPTEDAAKKKMSELADKNLKGWNRLRVVAVIDAKSFETAKLIK